MALTAGQIRRPRSSTSASRGLNADEQSSGVADLCRDLASVAPFLDDDDCKRIVAIAGGLRPALTESSSTKDVFRRGGGLGSTLQAIKELCQSGVDQSAFSVEAAAEAISSLLPLLSTAFSGHRGNERYFADRLDGWNVLHKSLLVLLNATLEDPDLERQLNVVNALLAGILHLAFGEDDGSRLATGLEIMPPIDSDEHAVANLIKGYEVIVQPQACTLSIRMLLRILQVRTSEGKTPLLAVSESALKLVYDLTSLCMRNKYALWETGITSHLLRVWLDGEATDDCCKTARNFLELLKGFGHSDLDDAASLFRRASESDDARALLLNTLQASKAPALIQFDLSQSGHSSVELKSLPRPFPPSIGYSLTAWFRFDEFDSRTHTTLFGAFDETQTCFLLAYLERDTRSLILQTSIRSSKPSVRFKSTKFVAGKWYHLAIVHRRSSADPKHSPVMLFVDGEFAEQVKIGYPETPFLEESHPRELPMRNPGRQARTVQAFFGTPADLAARLGRNQITEKWSLAGAHLYQVPLTDELVAVHHKLGPRYYGNTQDCLGPLLTYQASAELNRYNELLHPDKSEKSEIVTATEGRGSDVLPESKLLLSISPMAILNPDVSNVKSLVARYGLDKRSRQRYEELVKAGEAIAINTAVPTIGEALGKPYGCAILKGNPVVVLPKSFDDTAWCLSGCLPLLLKLLEAANSKAAFLQAVEIFFECIQDSWRISEAMEKGSGFGILSLIIREKLGFESGASASYVTSRKPSAILPLEDRQTLPLALLHLILKFVGYDSIAPENSMIVNPMGYRVLLVDFDTWRRCDAETQKLYYEQFVHFVGRNKHHGFNQKRLTRMRVLKRLIEGLKVEDAPQDCVEPLMSSLKALVDTSSAHSSYMDLAMFIAFGLHDERAQQTRPIKSIASAVQVRQRALSWARRGSSRPSTPGGASPVPSRPYLSRADLAVRMLELLTNVLSDDRSPTATKRFIRAVPSRWLSHMLSEPDVRVVVLAVRIACRCLSTLGPDFKTSFVDKNGGFVTLKARMKAYWRSPQLWTLAFAMMFGRDVAPNALQQGLTVFGLIEALQVNDSLRILHPEMLQPIMNMLEAALRDVVKTDEPAESDVKIVKTIMQFLSELYTRSAGFRDFATSSRYVQEILFVLYPVIVGSDRLSAATEYQAEKDSLSFKGEEVVMRPHSNSLGERPPSVRSLHMEGEKRTPSPTKRVAAPRRLSSFVLVHEGARKSNVPTARFNPAIATKSTEPVKLKVGNSLVESLLEVCVNLFLDLICNKKEFNGLGLFLKVPPGFREHQAYFESYVLVHTLSQLWNHLQLDQALLQETRVLTNLGRFCGHMAEAVFEGWFINGAQPVIDFIGKVLDYLQQPNIAAVKSVRLCAQAINTMRIVFLRVMLLRLSELDESIDEIEAISFLDQMNYWQTILFSTENQETPFIRLICYLLYMKLTTTVKSVRFAAARLWRTMLMQKPTETATLLTYAMGSEQRHLSTGFMKLVSLDDEDFIVWVDENRKSLDAIFIDALAKPWDDFVGEENRRNEDSARTRLNKRKEKLRQWQSEESSVDDFLQHYESSTKHWRANVHAQEKLKLQRSMQDHQENVHLVFNVFARLGHLMRQPCGLDANAETTKWQLDETEGANRMRMRTLPDLTPSTQSYQSKRKFSERHNIGKLAVNTQIAPIKDDIISPFPNTPVDATDGTSDKPGDGRSRGDSISNSQLLEGGFEMVEDPQEGEDGIIEDKNRKVMTSLQRGDMVQQLYNISRIVGLEACEGLLVIGKKCLYLQDNFFQRSDGEIVSVSQAPEDEKDPYVQLISGKDVGSQRSRNNIGEQASRNWTWMEVLSVSKRRFLFRDVSLEVFFTDGRSYLLTCIATSKRDELYSAIVSRAPHVHSAMTVASEDAWRLDNLRNPEEAPQSLGSRFASALKGGTPHAATKKWIKGDMSNFQYLMLINTMAGRSFNDLTQYPVFPWVLADYSSDELDLTNPKSFRDFSKPMGCQTPLREADYKDRYKQFAEMGDENAPPFHYGTHYSSAMIVTSYLIRMQPFVQSYLLLQGGNFDHADRLFDSIERAWLSASRENMTDVRELTPEFYYLPEFLSNINGYEFGAKQGNDELVGDVKLPPWAKGDPHIFIAKHREALESPYVSENLHRWVDLIFGFKQRGEAAIEATNVFQHLSYGGAKDLDNIEDPIERLATIGIIHSFGQTPYQVFPRPHPHRETEKFATARLDTMAESLTRLPAPLVEDGHKIETIIFSPTLDRVLCAGPCMLHMLPNCDRYIQWGFADHSLRFFSSNTRRLLGLYENTHIGPVTTTTFADSKTLITAGADCTLAIWTVTKTRDAIEIDWKTYLFGHRAPVTILAASRVFSTLLSVSADGQVLLWDLNRHDCIRSLLPPTKKTLQAAQISNSSGHIALCRGAHILLFTLNGHLLVEQKISDAPDDQILSCAFYNGAANEWVERELLFTGHSHGVVNVWALTTLGDGAWHLQLVNRLNHIDMTKEDGRNCSAGITALLPMANAVYTGDEDGKVWEWGVMQKQMNVSIR